MLGTLRQYGSLATRVERSVSSSARSYGKALSDRSARFGTQALFLRLARYNLVVLTGLTAHSEDLVQLGALGSLSYIGTSR